MPDSEPAAELDEFVSTLRDALTHYYDQAHLVRHPILPLLHLGSSDPELAVQELRRRLAAAIQRLRPRPDTPLSDPAWRPYAVVHQRFILGKDLDEVEAELVLGRRQLLREQRRALEAIAISLRPPDALAGQGEGQGSPLREEIDRVRDDQSGVNVSELLVGTLAPIQALAETCSVQLDRDCPPEPIYAVSNPVLLRQLMLAALSFVVRWSAGGRVGVGLSVAGHHPLLTIVACLPRPPDPAARATTPPEAVTALADAQQVAIGLEQSESGFTLSLTLRSLHEEKVIALVEDNPDTVRLFSRLLTGRSYRLVGLTESSTALAEIAELMPDVVILDLMMSSVDGWEILQRLKADPRLRRVPVVICSVLDEPELAASLGAAGYLRKPVRSTQLLDCLNSVLAN